MKATTFQGHGVALRDADGNFLCVPMVDSILIVDETEEAKAIAYPMSPAEIQAAPNGIHAFIRHRID